MGSGDCSLSQGKRKLAAGGAGSGIHCRNKPRKRVLMPYDIFGNPVTYEELAKEREETLNRRWFIAGVIVGFIICLAITF